ncbi:MAG: DUF4870 domain-containing protein [Rhodothermales bacterium]|nr:DUF4870 domain-containing protein [Rhodothermales bacterium]
MEDLPSRPSEDARNWAMIIHLSALVGFLGNGIGFLAAPLIIWLVKRDEDPFIDEQGKEALNFQITMAILWIVAVILVFVLVGIFCLLPLALLELVLPIVAGLRAREGESYRYPFTIRFIQ